MNVLLTNKELLNNKDLLMHCKEEFIVKLKNKISENSSIINKYQDVN